ncbi:acetyltransferase [Companilactobacillus sp. RD055328]|nr:CatB-related O-acetyltransferase [Companilactobacillus sp. RD055328]GKQ43142.1 acetyltransferase [Companilactobacillus sp. RD055328]
MSIFIRNIYRFIYKWQLYYQRKIQFQEHVMVAKSTKFEGGNFLAKNTIISNSKLGYGTFTGNNNYIVNTTIGRFTSIGSDLKIIIGNHPTNQFVSTHPAFYSLRKQAGFTYTDEQLFNDIKYVSDSKYCVEVGSDVWIGADVKILNGVTVGHGAVIAAGATVIKDVPDYAIVGGTPAKLIRYRFTEEQREKLIQDKWFDKDINWIKNHAQEMTDVEMFLGVKN